MGKVERTSNENIPSVQSLLEAVASAVGTLHTIDQESRKQLTTEFASISHSLSSVTISQQTFCDMFAGSLLCWWQDLLPSWHGKRRKRHRP